MGLEGIRFPVFRKYKNGRNYFKIISEREFDELRLIGNRAHFRKTVAVQYPEIIFIRDLINNYDHMADDITEAEYEAVRNSS